MEDESLPSPSSPPREEGPPPRLMITKMILENFKSYAGIREIGPFHKCFSSIVGPNGSGKSNVIDAMLFVFGKRAKQLRLNKVSELIHKSSQFQNRDFARVSVHFQEIIDTGDGDDDYVVLPDSERVVTRIARRDNSSTYKLDGKNCSFKDVALFLDSKGVDLDNNRFLILQGEVELISMMPPKGKTEHDEGLLEYLEDIIGSNKFVADTNLAAERVEQLTEQRQERLNRCKAVQAEKENLQGAKQEAQALLLKERDIRRKKNVLYQLHQMRLTHEVDQVLHKKGAMQERLEEERQRLTLAHGRVVELEQGLEKQRTEYEAVHAELQQTKQEFSAYERRDIKLREELKHCKTHKKKLETKIQTEADKYDSCVMAQQDANQRIPELEQEIQDLRQRKGKEDDALEAIFDEIKGVTDELRVELDHKNNELAPIAQERAVYQAKLDTATTQVKLLQDGVSRSQHQLEAAKQELASLDETQATKRNELAETEDELIACQQQVKDLELEDKALESKEASLLKRNKELLAQSEEAKAALQAKGGERSNAVEGILRAALKGGELANVGVLGRLGDLATIDEQYDVAISTACGMLDHIVVQTTAGAQRCLEFLRKHGLGRANFIPLDKMKKGAHDRAVETPENAPRLFQLIHPANFSVTPALYLGVGNTLVAPDLETATRWAYDFNKRWRVVTLDGQLIETSGTMAGGGNTVRKGGMKLKNAKSTASSKIASLEDQESVNDCKALEEEANKAMEELKDCRQRRREIAKDLIPSLKKRIKALSVKIPKLSMEIEGCDTTRATLTERIPELESQCELSTTDKAKLKELNSEVEKRKMEMASCAMQASKLEADVARLQKAILDAGGPKLKKQQAKCEKILKALDDAEKHLNEARVSIMSNQKAAAKAQVAKEASEEELVKLKTSIEEKQTEFKTLEEGAFEVMQKYETVKVTETEKREALEEVTAEVDDLKKSQAKLKGTEIELMGQVDALEKQFGECEKKRQHWETEIQKLHAAEEEDDDFDASDDEADEEPKKEDKIKHENQDMEMEEAEDEDDKQGEAREEQLCDKSSLPRLSFNALEQYSEEEVKKEINLLETERASLAKNANMGAIAEYRKKEADYLARVAELDAVTEERNSARKAHEELRRMRLEKFMDGFGQITLKLKEMYQMITLGGDAELELVDSLDPFSEGIVFSVRPPKKSWKNISNLSGGEKTLSSLALVFALHHYKPTPLYVMDEIDAALDFKNVSIVANYIKERTKNAQFVIISLRNNMFELADRLVGIYKTNNCTKSVTIDPRAFGVNGQQNGAGPKMLRDRTNVGTPSNRKDLTAEEREQAAMVVE